MSHDYFMDMMSPEEQKRILRLSSVCGLESWCLREYPDDIAIDTPTEQLTYTGLWSRVALFRGFLRSAGVQAGEKIAVVLPNSTACIVCFLAISTYGAVPVMVSASIPAEAQLESCAIAGCRSAFCLASLPGLQCWSPDGIDLTDSLPAADVRPEDPAAAFFTGGTSGLLKCALLSHKALMTGCYNGIFSPVSAFGQRYYGLIPFSHIFGTVRNLLTCLQTGSCIRPCSDMSRLVQDLKEFEPTVLVLIPALAGMLLNLAGLYGKEVFGSRLKVIVTGGAPQPTNIVRTYQEKFGITVVSGYGLTESANLVSGSIELLDRVGSVGKLYDRQEIRFVDDEIQLRGDNIFIGYINNPAETEAAFDNGWLKTGDLGYMDEDGYLYITGRSKNLIYFTNGEKICPEQIEAKVDLVPGVKASLVSMKTNRFNAQVLTCEIYRDPSVSEESLQAAVDRINLTLPDFSRVRQVLFRTEDFPRTGAMKIRRY